MAGAKFSSGFIPPELLYLDIDGYPKVSGNCREECDCDCDCDCAVVVHSTLLYSTLLYSTPFYSTLLYSTLLHSTVHFIASCPPTHYAHMHGSHIN